LIDIYEISYERYDSEGRSNIVPLIHYSNNSMEDTGTCKVGVTVTTLTVGS